MLRQGGPLSPFLFTLVVDVLSRLVERAKDHQTIEGLRVGREEVEIIHVQFPIGTNCFFALLFASNLWQRLFMEAGLSWAFNRDCWSLMWSLFCFW